METLIYFSATALPSIIGAMPNEMIDTSCLSKQAALVILAAGGMLGMAQSPLGFWLVLVGVLAVLLAYAVAWVNASSRQFTPTTTALGLHDDRNTQR